MPLQQQNADGMMHRSLCEALRNRPQLNGVLCIKVRG